METGELIAQAAFTQENRGDPKGGSLFKALRQPVQLPAGFKVCSCVCVWVCVLCECNVLYIHYSGSRIHCYMHIYMCCWCVRV
jgi:hypothetical protein